MSLFGSSHQFKKAGLYHYVGEGTSSFRTILPQQDPTYLSFTLLFAKHDEANSPLLADGNQASSAEAFLAKLPHYSEKLQALRDFKAALFKINNEMPWYWQVLKGADRLQQYDVLNPYWGGEEAKITISCLESINLAITGLMDLYRKAVFDIDKWVYVIPANLRKFSMYIYVDDVRTLKPGSYKNPKGKDVIQNEMEITGDNGALITGDINVTSSNKTYETPIMMFRLDFCEFDITSGTIAFSELNNAEPTAASQEIIINYEGLRAVKGSYLEGIISEAPDEIEARNTLNVTQLTDADVLANNKRNIYNPNNERINPLQTRINGIVDQASTSLKNLSQAKKAEYLDAVNGSLQTIVPIPVFTVPTTESIIMNAVNQIDRATHVSRSDIEQAILGNIYDVSPGDAITGALKQGVVNGLGLGNVYK